LIKQIYITYKEFAAEIILVTTFGRLRTSPTTGWDKTLSIRMYSTRLTRQEKNKMTPRICKAYLVELAG
jgi:hypothetical protein